MKENNGKLTRYNAINPVNNTILKSVQAENIEQAEKLIEAELTNCFLSMQYEVWDRGGRQILSARDYIDGVIEEVKCEKYLQ